MNEKEKVKIAEAGVAKRQFLFMKTLDLYVLKEYLIIYICCNLAFCMMFMISDMINKLGDFSGTGASVWTIAYFFLLLQPYDIKFVLPIALLLSCMYTLARFGMNNEITAMRASGVSLIRCGVSIYFIGLLVTFVNFWFNEDLVPNCSREAEILRKTAKNPDYFKRMTRMLLYPSPDNARTWLVQSFENPTELNNVQVKKYNKDGSLDLEVYAGKVHYSPLGGWVFNDVNLVKYKSIKLLNEYGEESKGETSEVRVPQMDHLDIFDKTNKDYSLLGDIIENPNDMLNILKDPDQLASKDIWRKLTMTKELDKASKSALATEFYSRLAFPWVCVLSVFLGIPLAGSNARRGVMLSIVAAVAVIVIYTVIQQIFMILGNQGYVPPLIAAFVPTFSLVGYVIYIIVKHR